MNMHVKDFLHRGFTICKKQIHSFTPHISRPQRSGETVSHTHQVSCSFVVYVGEIRPMLQRDYEQMSRVDWLNVHKRCAHFIAVDETNRELTGENSAEYAIGHGARTESPVVRNHTSGTTTTSRRIPIPARSATLRRSMTPSLIERCRKWIENGRFTRTAVATPGA